MRRPSRKGSYSAFRNRQMDRHLPIFGNDYNVLVTYSASTECGNCKEKERASPLATLGVKNQIGTWVSLIWLKREKSLVAPISKMVWNRQDQTFNCGVV